MIKLQVRGSSSRLGRFTLTPIVEAEYMAATGFLTQISDRYLHLGWVHIWRSGTDSNFRYHEWDLLTPETTVASGQFFIRSWMDLFQESGWRQPGSGLEAANACSSIASARRIKAGAESYRSRMVAGTFSGKSSSFPLCEGAELSTGSHHFIFFRIRLGPISPSQ